MDVSRLGPRRWMFVAARAQQAGIIVVLVLVAIAVVADSERVGAVFAPTRDLALALVG